MKALYRGDGEFFRGIPARDLSEEELSALDPEQREMVESSRLYELVEDAAPRKRGELAKGEGE